MNDNHYATFSLESAFATYALTGVLLGTFRASDEARFERLAALAGGVGSELVAKTALACREASRTSDVPAFLVALLAARDTAVMTRVFPRVIDDGRTLRSFVEIVRSGVTGRKSFGSAPKRAIRSWFASRSPEAIFRQSIGHSPSMSDVIKMVRPPPRNDKGEADAVREALYGYLIGKSVNGLNLPALARAFEAWKHGEGPLPDVPFEMLATMPLRAADWRALAPKMSLREICRSLDLLLRHGVLDDAATVESLAARIADRDAIRRSRVMPYELFASVRRVTEAEAMPPVVVRALTRALEMSAEENVPVVSGHLVVCPDLSGSMHSPAVRHPKTGAAGSIRCVDVAALVAAALLRRTGRASVLPFTDDVVAMDHPLVAEGGVAANVERLAAIRGGGTACAAPLRFLRERGISPDLVVFVSDKESWSELEAAMAEDWHHLRALSPKAKLVLVDVRGKDAPVPSAPRSDVLRVAGFSDAVFDVIAAFARGDLDDDAPLQRVEATPL